VTFANERTELRQLLLLAAASLAVELFLLPGMMFRLLAASAEWPVPLQLLALFLPRFIVMLALVLLFGPFRKGLWFGGVLAAYTALAVVRFYQSEAFVDWNSAIAASRATLPYVAGIVGTILAFWLRRKDRATAVISYESRRPS
jgi:hypothetical protein